MDKLKLMETYVRVVRCGSFTAAADQLGVARAVVTKHIAQLEQGLGCRLLNRTTRLINPTEIGLNYFKFCDHTLREIVTNESLLTRLQDEPRGSLKLAAPKAFASLHLGGLIAGFSARYPNIEVASFVRDSSLDEVNLLENDFDLAIRLSRPVESSIIVRKICTFDWITCASPAYIKKGNIGRLRQPKELAAVNCLTHTRFTADGLWRFYRGDAETSVKVSGTMKSNSVLTLRGAALGGLGVALLPAYCIMDDVANGSLRRLLTDYRGPTEELSVLYPYGAHIPKKVRVFVDYLIEQLRRPPWTPQSA